MKHLIAMLTISSLSLVACATASPTLTPLPTSLQAPVASRPTTTARVAVRIDRTPAPIVSFADDNDEQPAATIAAERKELIAAMPKVGSLAPDFTLPTLDGGAVTLSQLRGHPIIINFWASWCVPCRAEAPELQRAHEQYRAQGLIILGMNDTSTDTRDNASAFVKEFHLDYAIPMDEKGEVSNLYRVPGLPTTFFVDAQGVIRNLIMGQLNRADLEGGIEMIKTWQ